MGLFKKLFGTYSDRQIKKLRRLADRIDELAPQYEAMTNEELAGTTKVLKDRLAAGETLEVVIPPELLERIPENRREALRGVLAQDPRPHYQDDPTRVYSMRFADLDVHFTVSGGNLTVTSVDKVE